MPNAKTVKSRVRERDNQRCCDCGMTAEDHKRRFGRGLHVHRKEYISIFSLGSYEEGKCETLCTVCHQAKHWPDHMNFRWSIRKRDGYACTECGMSYEEHRKVHGCPLPVHCTRAGLCHAKEREWTRQNVKPEECYTLCSFCHLSKHSIRPAVLRRDKFQCVDCGMKPDDNRLWHKAVTVHRLSGYCDEDIGPDADQAGFVTLCRECHEKRHPDKFAECIQYGGTVCLDKGMAVELDITLPITSKDLLALYKEYLLVVNRFIQHFRKNGIPANDRQLCKVARDFPETGLSRWPREQAAVEARDAFTRAPIGFFSRKEEEAMRKMSEEEKKAFLREREEKHLDRVIARNAEPTIEIEMKNGHRCRLKI